MNVFCRTLVVGLLFTSSAAALEVGVHDASVTVNGTKTIPIPLPPGGPRKSESHTIPIGDGKSVVHVRVTNPGGTWEAIVSGGANDPIFAGLTGYTTGEEGERTGQQLLITDRDADSKYVLVADVREDTRICGQAMTPLSVRGLDPRTMTLRGASLHRIEKKERDAATNVTATLAGADVKPPLARLFGAMGASSGRGGALTDGKADTAWTEERSGDGHGEFVSMRAPTETPLHSLVLTMPVAGSDALAMPRTFFVATDTKLFHVTLPEEKAGATFEVPFPEPVRTSCVALVLDEAYDHDTAAPRVAIAEVGAKTKLDADGATLDDVVKELAGARVDEAAAVLRRAGDPALAAVAAAWPKLDARGRTFAVDVAASTGSCAGPAMELLTKALTDREREVRGRAVGRIERCGKNAIESLAAAVRAPGGSGGAPGPSDPQRAAAASMLASISAAAAWDPIADQIGRGSAETRHAMRAALAKAARSTPKEKMAALLSRADLTPDMKLDALRALGPRIVEVKPEAEAALATVLAGAPDFRTRYLAVEPIANLGDRARLARLATTDPDWPVRARALELANPRAEHDADGDDPPSSSAGANGADGASAGAGARRADAGAGGSSAGAGARRADAGASGSSAPPRDAAFAGALADPEPRVREAALRANVGAAAPALRDEWSFVRVAAAESLGATRDSTEALAGALRDPSRRVRGAAVTALGNANARGQAPKIRARLDDVNEDIEVRALSARTLGKLCVQDAADRLTHLAVLAAHPIDEADERIGTAALDALAMLHPTDIEKRLAPLRAQTKGARTLLARAADRAVTERGLCR